VAEIVKEGALAPDIAHAASVLARDVPHLVRESLELAKLEAKVAAQRVAVRAGLLALFGVFAFMGLFFACVAASIGISQLAETAWAGPLVVGGFLLIVALIGVPFVLKSGSASEEEPDEEKAGKPALAT
jgi:hypothetical protein